MIYHSSRTKIICSVPSNAIRVAGIRLLFRGESQLLAPPLRTDSSWFKPGMAVARSGVYRVYHYAHRAPHEVIISAGTVLPKCRNCGDRVQFAPLISGEPLENDRDLAASDSTAA